MKAIGKYSISLAISIALTGCASTSDTSSNQGPAYPELKVLSETPYVWDNSASEALNVARMAQPAGVGVGMQDFPDGTKATTGRYSGGERALDAALGLASMGVFGIISMESLNQGANKQLEWKPATVDLIKESDILTDGKYSFLKLRDIISERHKSAISKKFPGIIWGDTLTFRHAVDDDRTHNVSLVIKSEDCHNIRKLNYSNKNDFQPYVNGNYQKFYTDGKNISENHCIFGYKMSLSNVTEVSGTRYLSVVSEIKTGFYLVPALTSFYSGYTIVPDFYEVNSVDAITAPYAFVTKNGKELKFQSK